MRVSERMRYETVQGRVERAKDYNLQQLDRLSSQKDILSISDDPNGVVRSIRLRDQISNLRQYQKNIEFSNGYMNTSEKALASMSDNLVRAKELAVAMANGTYDAASRDATSREVKEIIEELNQLGNTSFAGRFVFGGFRSQTPPVSLDGDFLGDDGAIFLQVSRENLRQINVPSRGLFEVDVDEQASGHLNLLQVPEILHHGLISNDVDLIRKSIDELDYQLEKVNSFQATLGAISKSLADTSNRLSSEESVNRTSLSKIEDTDLYDATSEFKRTEAVLQGTLMASTKLLQPSLLNFMQ